jgi:hypothetical protein
LFTGRRTQPPAYKRAPKLFLFLSRYGSITQSVGRQSGPSR